MAKMLRYDDTQKTMKSCAAKKYRMLRTRKLLATKNIFILQEC
jgi:hypothetical protein